MKQISKPDEALIKILPVQELNPEAVYVLSQFVLPYDHEGRHILCNNLTREIVELDRPLREHISAREIEKDANLFAMMQRYILVPKGKDECAFYEGLSRILRNLKKPKGIKDYIILPTLACNARCVYCYEADMEQKTMTPETVEQTIRYIMRTKAEGAIHICWFGGEPLLGETIIDRLCEGLQAFGVEYTSDIITNGSLLTEAIADKMVGMWNATSTQISMDGPEQEYIARKRYREYQDTYHAVMQKVNLLTERDIRVSIRCNVDETNINGVPEFLSDLSKAISDREKVHVYLAPLHELVRNGSNLSMIQRILDADNPIQEAGFRVSVSNNWRKTVRINHCMADSGNVLIAPDGRLFACDLCVPESYFGDIWHGVTDKEGRSAFCSIDRTLTKCRKCSFLPECTSFSSCPGYTANCKEYQMMQMLSQVKRLLDSGIQETEDEESGQACC